MEEGQISEIGDFVATDLTREEEDSLKSALLKSREATRAAIAKRLILLLGITVAFSILLSVAAIFAPAASDTEREDRFTYSKDVFSILLSTQTGLIGAALGFYFGSKEDG